MIVRWRTTNATGGLVRYGTTFGNLSSTVSHGATTNRHTVPITGLTPDTKYYYELGTGTEWIPGSTNQFFVTSPVPGTPKPTRIWVLGDSGEPGPEAYSVRDAYAALARAEQRGTDLWLMLGDNAYDSGTDAEYQAAVFETYPAVLRNTVLWPTVGNHDKDPAYYEIFSLPPNGEAGGVPSGTESYYSFDYGNIHFICLDSYRGNRTTNGAMYQWLLADLQAHTGEWLIAFWHHPPYTKGTHDSDTETELIQMRQTFIPLLESYGVDLVLCGHSHNYERSYLIDGHYGLTTTFTPAMKKNPGNGRESGDGPYVKPGGGEGNQGAVYTVAGNGSKSSNPDPQPAMYNISGEVGSLIIDIVGNRMDVKHLEGSSNVTDFFTMIKEPTATEPPGGPGALTASALSTNQITLAWTDQSTNESSFRIERSTNGINFSEVASTPANVTNFLDGSLAPSRTFHYRVRARNSAGDSAYSAMAQATTLTPPPPPADNTAPGNITNLLVTAVTSNTVRLRWSAPGDDDYTGTATAYELRFHTAFITEANWNSATPFASMPAPLPAGSTQNVTVTGLETDTLYHFGIKTRDESNNVSQLSNIASAVPTNAPPPPGSVLGYTAIPSNSVWKYLDNGTDQGAAWRNLAFNDSAWESGPAQIGFGNFDDVTTAGFGPDPDNKFITTYFRRDFTLADPSLFSSWIVRVRRDDGVVVYVNGAEVFRENMPDSAIDYLTRASTGSSGTNKTMFHSSPPFSSALLVPGTNLVAAEVHLRGPGSSQMSFNLELVGVPSAPRITALQTNGQIVLTWAAIAGQRYRVERTSTLPPTAWVQHGQEFTATNNVARVLDPATDVSRFYRVRTVN